MIFTFLLVVQAVVAVVLVTLILMQRSEGGGLGVGGSSSGLMTARGQADFLTRATAITAMAFVVLCILLAGIATQQRTHSTIDTSLVAPADGGSGEAAPAAPADGAAPPPAGGTDSVDSDILSTLAGEEGGDAGSEEQPAGE